MNIEERVAEAILIYNRVINVMSPNTVYMGESERMEMFERDGIYRPEYFMGLLVVPVALQDYLQVARVEPKSMTFAGFTIVEDPSLAPNEIKVVKP